MTYQRVIPRDLFNEGNLLKCLGKLALIAHENCRPAILRVTHTPGPFDIRQDPGDGSISAANVHIVVRERLFEHRRPINSREPWPLWLRPLADPDMDEIEAFDQDGNLSAEFRALIWPQCPHGEPLETGCADCKREHQRATA